VPEDSTAFKDAIEETSASRGEKDFLSSTLAPGPFASTATAYYG